MSYQLGDKYSIYSAARMLQWENGNNLFCPNVSFSIGLSYYRCWPIYKGDLAVAVLSFILMSIIYIYYWHSHITYIYIYTIDIVTLLWMSIIYIYTIDIVTSHWMSIIYIYYWHSHITFNVNYIYILLT